MTSLRDQGRLFAGRLALERRHAESDGVREPPADECIRARCRASRWLSPPAQIGQDQSMGRVRGHAAQEYGEPGAATAASRAAAPSARVLLAGLR